MAATNSRTDLVVAEQQALICAAIASNAGLRKRVKDVLKAAPLTTEFATLKHKQACVTAAAKHLKRAGLSDESFTKAQVKYDDAILALEYQLDLVNVSVGEAVVTVAQDEYTQRALVLQGMQQSLALEQQQWESQLRQERAMAVVRNGSSGVVVREARELVGEQSQVSLTANAAVQSAAFLLGQQDDEEEKRD